MSALQLVNEGQKTSETEKELKIELNETDQNNEAPLLAAAFYNRIEIIKFLLNAKERHTYHENGKWQYTYDESGKLRNSYDENGNLLENSAEKSLDTQKHIDTRKRLVEKFIKDSNGYSPIMAAAEQNNIEALHSGPTNALTYDVLYLLIRVEEVVLVPE